MNKLKIRAKLNACSVEYTALIGGDHIFNIDESIFSTMDFEHFQGLLDKVSKVETFSLTVIYFVSQILIFNFEKVEYWENLSVVRH